MDNGQSLHLNNLKIKNQQVTLVDQVEDKLLEYFRTMELRPGDQIPKEEELTDALGVGRSVLREALSRLRMLGLVESRTKRGMVLSEPSLLGGMRRVMDPKLFGEKVLIELLGFRVALEIGICEQVVDNITEEDIVELENIVNKGVSYKHGEYTPVSEYEFHTKLYAITGNKTIMEFQEILHPVCVFMKKKFRDNFLPINMELERAGRTVTHKDLLGYLKKRDKKAFTKAMTDHFAVYNKFLKRKQTGTDESD